MNKKQFDALRHKKKMTLEQLSEKTDIPVSTLTKISAGYTEPSFQKMCRIAQALDCSLDDFTENSSSSVSKDDRELLHKYHNLTDHSKTTIQMLLKQMSLTHSETVQTPSSHTILCIQPTFFHGDAFQSESYSTNMILVSDHTIYGKADFALQVATYSFSPIFCIHDILYLQYRFPEVREIGLFQYDDKLFLRRLSPESDKLGGIYLKPIQFEHSTPERYDSQNLQCLGTVFASQHTCSMQSNG